MGNQSIAKVLREFYTLSQAAKYLSDAYKENFEDADILRFALDGHLKLSILFHKEVWAQICDQVNYDVVKLNEEIAQKTYTDKLMWIDHPDGMELISLSFETGKYLNIRNEYRSLSGMFDLPRFGDAWIHVIQKWREMICEPKVEHPTYTGIFLEGYNGVIFRLNGVINISEYLKNHLSKQRELKRLIAVNNISKENAEALFIQLEEERDIFLKQNHKVNLPEDSVFVVRSEAFWEFEQNIESKRQDNKKISRTHGNTEINTKKREEVIGAAFSILAKWPEECRNEKGNFVASKIAKMVEIKAGLFWPEASPPLKLGTIEELIREWIKKTGGKK